MNIEITPSDSEELESMIDRCGLAETLNGLANICLNKAEHIITNWQDRQTASHWTSAATDLQDLARNKNYL